eukprot:CAMPEP_0114358466 /NCGR_PEP_ID=MMETSP0101-20121206/22322_1 /TAXON_ID=38822 ORGANISM="Pteridomonas danica, Strain PT" /NCGR_SAMPLE_ID=MMETSP0101 /ASSEMBLY_ACC=CAM_ASM_000211 /LENGTH=130 /DNA_ID=CAMNT_0001501591 /DNA_START=95 /DNA_END=484 /DNA_ORIENTATION=+
MVSDEILMAELVSMKRQEPDFGVQKLSAKLRETKPEWQFNTKKVRSLLREIKIMEIDEPEIPEPISNGEPPSAAAAVTVNKETPVIQAVEKFLKENDLKKLSVVNDETSSVEIVDASDSPHADVSDADDW